LGGAGLQGPAILRITKDGTLSLGSAPEPIVWFGQL